jgi:site-specific DNA recombinase
MTSRAPICCQRSERMTSYGYLGNPCRQPNALNTADTTAGTIPSSMKEGIKQIIIGRTLRTLRSIAMDWNERGVKIVGGGTWQGSMIRRVLISPRIAKLKENRGEIVGEATWPGIIDRATHDRLVGLLGDESRRPANYGRPRVHPLAGLHYCGSCGGHLVTYLQPKQTCGYGCRKDENLVCPGRVRIAAEPLEMYVAGYVIEQWRNPAAIKIAQSDDDRMERIRELADEMRNLQEQKNEALRMKLRGEVDAKTFREVTLG